MSLHNKPLWLRRPFRLALKIALALSLHTALAQGAQNRLCAQVHGIQKASTHRLQIIDKPEVFELSSMVEQLQKDGQLFYKGSTSFQPGTEFLASNEFDWLETPFDNKPADTLVAFGTNSAWEIAVNKKVKQIYLADWSPYPLLAHAYLIAPLIKISKTPQDFLTFLSGELPTEQTSAADVDSLLSYLTHIQREQSKEQKMSKVKNLLIFLAQQNEVSDFELKFLTSYFTELAGHRQSAQGIGPFQNLRQSVFAHLLLFYDNRYRTDRVQDYNPKFSAKEVRQKLHQYSVMSNLDRFLYLKNIFKENRIQYAWGSISDKTMYKKIAEQNELSGYRDTALSITNIFDCTYTDLNFLKMQNYFKNLTVVFKSSAEHPVVVFRTVSTAPPHRFYRYDLQSLQSVPAKDEPPLTESEQDWLRPAG